MQRPAEPAVDTAIPDSPFGAKSTSADSDTEVVPRTGPPAPDVAKTGGRVRALLAELGKARTRIHDLERELKVAKLNPPSGALRELADAPIEHLLEVADLVKRVGGEKLLAVPADVASRFTYLSSEEASGIARILHRGKYDMLVAQRGGGAYYSFATRTNDYNKEPDLELQNGYYSTSFYGGTFGFIIDLGAVALDTVPRDSSAAPQGIAAEVWKYLWEAAPADRRARRDFQSRGRRLKLRDRVKAKASHTYVVRAVLPGEHDLLVAFRDVHRDKHGHSIAFRELARWDAPR